MKIKQNIGILNALIRITIGLTLLSWSSIKLARKPYCSSYLWLMISSAMKVAEGIVRYCPLTDLMKNYQLPNKEHEHEDMDSNNTIQPYNPT